MDNLKSSYSSNFSSGFNSGYGISSGFSGSSGYSNQNKKNVVIKMIETKDGRVVSESSEVIED